MAHGTCLGCCFYTEAVPLVYQALHFELRSSIRVTFHENHALSNFVSLYHILSNEKCLDFALTEPFLHLTFLQCSQSDHSFSVYFIFLIIQG